MPKIYQGIPYNKPVTLNAAFGIGVMDNNNFDGNVVTMQTFFDQAYTLGLITPPSAAGWELTGNAGTDPNTNYIGTSDGADLIIQPSTGNVGIGSVSPTSKLFVAGDNNNIALYVSGGTGTSAQFDFNNSSYKLEDDALDLKTDDGTNPVTRINGAAGELILYGGNSEIHVNGDESITLHPTLPTGTVGIGTASPTNNLEAVGSFQQTRDIGGNHTYGIVNNIAGFGLYDVSNDFTTTYGRVTIDDTAIVIAKLLNGDATTGSSVTLHDDHIEFLYATATVPCGLYVNASGPEMYGPSNDESAFQFRIMNNGGTQQGTELARFSGTGRLGLGTSIPDEKLDVVGNIKLSGTIKGAAIAAYDDDTAAGLGGLTTGDFYQTTGAGAAPLNVAGILMVKQ